MPGVARRQLTFLASPRKVSQRRRPQSRRPCGLPSATRNDRPLRNSGSLVQIAKGSVCARPQTVLADCSGRSCVARRLLWGPRVAHNHSLPGEGRGPSLQTSNWVPDQIRDDSPFVFGRRAATWGPHASRKGGRGFAYVPADISACRAGSRCSGFPKAEQTREGSARTV